MAKRRVRFFKMAVLYRKKERSIRQRRTLDPAKRRVRFDQA